MTPEDCIKQIGILATLLGFTISKYDKQDIYISDGDTAYVNVYLRNENILIINPDFNAPRVLFNNNLTSVDFRDLSNEDKYTKLEKYLVRIRNKLNEHNT